MADLTIIDVGNIKWTLFQKNIVLSRTVEGLHIQTNGLAMLLKIIPLKLMLKI
jgi:hypothetical protein